MYICKKSVDDDTADDNVDACTWSRRRGAAAGPNAAIC